jgi:tRNA modification GTPase
MIELDVKSAWYSLGEIIGDTNSDTLITELFSRFCLGK